MTDVHVPSAHEVETYSGRFVDVERPQASDIDIVDIAHALANTCRYGGHCRRYYSVAEHAVFVSKRLERKGFPKHIQIAGLHHDDAEAFLGDIPRPMKPLLGKAYERMTDRMDAAIVDGLGLEEFGVRTPTFHFQEIKDADNWALFVEARHLLPSQGKGWWDGEQGAETWNLGDMPKKIVVPDYWKDGLEPEEAEALFLERHFDLCD